MNISSHLALGVNLGKQFGLNRWNLLNFLLGSIVPDITLSFVKYPHTPEIMSYAVMDELQRSMLKMEEGYSPNYLRLGILIHFFADFFCSVHNHPIGNLKQFHYMYEKKLESMIVSSDCKPEMFIDLADSNLSEWINTLHKSYCSELFGLERDIKYIPMVCSRILFGFSELTASEAIREEEKLVISA